MVCKAVKKDVCFAALCTWDWSQALTKSLHGYEV